MRPTEFITRQGHRLMEGERPFRFAGPNIYWLGLDENVDGVDWPTPFRVRDALDTAVRMGATVVRSHTLGASQGCEKAISPVRGEYNEEALRRVDFAIKEAGERGLRLIIPFVCNWSYYHGGRSTFTAWRGLDDPDLFYSDQEVIGDFKGYIDYILNRKNTYTGLAYKDDPTILAWELGNELNGSSAEWVEEIAYFIKLVDPNHLVAHGKQFGLEQDKLHIPSLDILDVHYYPANHLEMLTDAEEVARAGKVYINGEFGWPDCDLDAFLACAEQHDIISGTLFWSLFGHHDRGGYVQHYDGFSVHYPGTGVNGEVKSRIQNLRRHAFAMNGLSVPAEAEPAAPDWIHADRGALAFRRVAGAAYYTVEKSVGGEHGPWSPLYEQRAADDAAVWLDPTRVQSVSAYYRVKGFNVEGTAGPYSKVLLSEPFK